MKTSKRKRAAAPAAEVVVEAGIEPAAVVAEAQDAPAPAPGSAAPIAALSSVCTVKDAAALKETLCKLLDESASVTLDIRSVERVDTAIFQLLYAFVRDRAERGLGVTWLGAPEAVSDAAALLGVRALLNLPAKESLGVAA